jgi:GcrA cell cycle regulator
MSLWSEERVELMKQLRAAGRSAGQIAAQLGYVTRNAVIGKLHRLGIPSRIVEGRNRPAVPRMDLKRDRKRDVGLGKKFPPVSAATYDQAVTFEDLKQHQCRWPLDGPHGRRSCGSPVHDGTPVPYCDEHFRRAYLKPWAR